MNHENKIAISLRPLWLTMALCVVMLAGAVDLVWGTRLIGMTALMAGAGILSVILLTCETYISVLDSLVPLILLYFAGGMRLWVPAVGAVSIICALVISRLIKKKTTKSAAVVTITIVLLVCFLIIAAVFYALEGHSLAFSDILKDINQFFDETREKAAAWANDYIDSLSQSTIQSYENLGISKDALREYYITEAKALVDTLQLTLPGLLLIGLQIFAYLAVCFFVLTVKSASYDALLPEVRWVLYPTQITCIVFLAAIFFYMIALFFPSTVFAILVVNLLLVLSPSMIACGVRGLSVRLRHPMLRKRTIVILVLFVFFALFMTSTALQLAIILLSILGAKDVFSLRMAESEMRKKKK